LFEELLAFGEKYVFVVSQIYMEGIHVADKLASLDLTINENLWFDSCPIVFRSDLVRNRFCLSNFLFS
jgi:hypothetical protein